MITAFTCGGTKAIDCIKGLYALDCMDIFWIMKKKRLSGSPSSDRLIEDSFLYIKICFVAFRTLYLLSSEVSHVATYR